MEKIIRIEEISDNQDGYLVITDKQTIRVAIDNGQSCCENWGYFSSHDDFEEFIGAELLDIRTTDSALNVQALKDLKYVESDSCMFVTFYTNKGDFQLTVYNEHNGYYSHKVNIESTQLTEECYL